MAPPKAGKTKYNLRMRPAAIEAYKDIACRAGFSTHAALCAKILDDCLEYLLDTDRTQMPDVLLDLKKKLSTRQFKEVADRLKKEPETHDTLEQFVNALIDRRLATVSGRKKKSDRH